MIGGALVHVGNCTPLNGCPGDETLDGGGFIDYIDAHPLPANGTFVREADGPQAGLIARVAGGAFLTISDCSALGGCPSSIVALDSDGFGAWSSAHPVPVDGTYLLGLPSNTTWEMVGSQRQTASASTSAVAVDDSSLNPIPQVPAPSTTTTPAPVSRPPPHLHRPAGPDGGVAPPRRRPSCAGSSSRSPSAGAGRAPAPSSC